MDINAYERLVFDNAASIASRAGSDADKATALIDAHVLTAGLDPRSYKENIFCVREAIESKNFRPEPYRGVLADEGVIEELKEILRDVHVVELYPEHFSESIKQFEKLVATYGIIAALQMSGGEVCGCMGPQHGAPLCPCAMERRVAHHVARKMGVGV